MKRSDISIVIPVYNGEQHIARCLDSILSQTMSPHEVLVMDDGSIDSTPQIVKEYKGRINNLNVRTQKNAGQGVARNKAVYKVSGGYVFFVDADDEIKPNAIEQIQVLIDSSKADVIRIGWELLTDGKTDTTVNDAPAFTDTCLRGNQVDQLLRSVNYFGTLVIARVELLKQAKILFGEGYIYEDNQYVTGLASHAQSLAIITSPLYMVHAGAESSTRSKVKDGSHIHSFMKAIEASFAALVPRTPNSKTYLKHYFVEKYLVYFRSRVTWRLRWSFTKQFAQQMRQFPVDTESIKDATFFKYCESRHLFERRHTLQLYVLSVVKVYLMPIVRGLYK